DKDPSNVSLREDEAATVIAFNEALVIKEKFLKQKAKIAWLKEGDSNSAYFHKAIKSRISRSRIDVVTDAEGVVFQNDDVAKAFISHYEVFLGQPGITHEFNTTDLFLTRLSSSEALEMVRTVSSQEVKTAIFSMGNDKSLGPDGFTTAFFKDTWDIISPDVTRVVFNSPARVNDYKPISCCNVLFKCISKIIANRLKDSLKRLVSPNQSAFVPGRSISDNILLTQEIMHNYHLDRGVPRCAFKVDIQKAYDTVDWEFLRVILIGFGFHVRMVSWIMECVATTSFSISINGSLHGYFKGKRGLRQGDPLSPYLFTLIMEVLTLMLHRKVREDSSFTYHRQCSKLELINLCFADDLFLFAHGDVNSARVIKEALDEFKDASGLVPSLPKSTAYFCNVLNHTKLAILHILPFEEGRLSVKYLGVPLVSSRLIFRDCKELIVKVQDRGLCISVFILPTRVLLDIEQLMRGFLWCQGNMRKGKAKVSWEAVCLPKDEGGLGVRRLDHFNKALIVSHVWKLLSLKESLLRCGLISGALLVPSVTSVSTSWYILRAGDFDHNLRCCDFPVISVDKRDYLEWRDNDGNGKPFSVHLVWSIRPRDNVVPWVVAAAEYFVWQERNRRLFKHTKRSAKEVTDCIMSSVRMKLLSCHLKTSKDRVEFVRLWELPKSTLK
ncbi:hypothetical protein Tco_0885628, partial [Tanacetum coccineum]